MIASFLIRIKVGFQVVGEKEQFQYQEHYYKLDENDCPQLFPQGHTSEPLPIKLVYVSDNLHSTKRLNLEFVKLL
jgi:hypothetical protein